MIVTGRVSRKRVIIVNQKVTRAAAVVGGVAVKRATTAARRGAAVTKAVAVSPQDLQGGSEESERKREG